MADAASEAVVELTSLGDDFREICDNTPDSLQQTSVYETRDSTASEIESISEPDYPAELSDVKVKITDPPQRRRGYSRADKCGQSVYVLQQCVDRLDEFVEENKKNGEKGDSAVKIDVDAAETLRDELQNIIDVAEGLEWPGMFG